MNGAIELENAGIKAHTDAFELNLLSPPALEIAVSRRRNTDYRNVEDLVSLFETEADIGKLSTAWRKSCRRFSVSKRHTYQSMLLNVREKTNVRRVGRLWARRFLLFRLLSAAPS
jgi:hypothetical protein